MGEFILSYEKYLHNDEDELNEGWKTWLSTFMLLLNLGIVPPKIQASDLNTKIEWVQSVPEGTINLAKLAAFLTRDSHVDIDDKDEVVSKIDEFNKSNGTKLNYDMVRAYLKCESYTRDKSTYYKWSFNPPSKSAVGMDMEKIQPAKYGMGISLISDYGDFMNPKMEDSLNQVLFKYEKLTGVEIAILTVPSLQDQDPADFTIKTFNRWGIGKKGANNGILILTSMGDRKYWIAVGYGMEDIFPDALAKRFGENCLVPNFREGEYEQGFKELIEEMKEEFGNIPIERKKELEKKYDQIAKENVKNFFIGAGEIALLLLAMGLIAYLIYAGAKKRKELREQIARVKAELSRVDRGAADLIVDEDPVFNDESILGGIKIATEELAKKKIRGEKSLAEFETRLDECAKQLRYVQNVEKELSMIKKNSMDIFRKLKGYEDKPTEMKAVGEAAFNMLNGFDFKKLDISTATLDKYRKMFDKLSAFYKNYEDFYKKLSYVTTNIQGFDKIKTDLLNKLKDSAQYVDKVKELGYQTGVETKEEDIESLKNFVDRMGNIYMTDLVGAMDLLTQYGKKVYSMEQDILKPMAKFNDIVTATKYVKDNEKNIEDVLRRIQDWHHRGYVRSNEVEDSKEIANSYEEIKDSKDVLRKSATLQTVLQKLENILQKGQNRLEEEEEERRRKREEEEEEERRRKRRMEEERSHSYGGGYGGGGYGGGGGGFSFGGGSCGGGGSGGSW